MTLEERMECSCGQIIATVELDQYLDLIIDGNDQILHEFIISSTLLKALNLVTYRYIYMTF
jgi:hypothetical protein